MSYRIQCAEVDVGNMLFEDKAPLDFDAKGQLTEQHLSDSALECVNHFFKLFWALPTQAADGTTVSVIPPLRELTKWERYAKLKGIHNKKESRKVWDPETKTWRPRWGRGRVNDIKDKWCIEVPDNADPYEDQFAKLTKAKTERRAENELKRLRNISRTVKPGQAPPIGVLTESGGSKNEFNRALSIARRSDASMGQHAQLVDERSIAKKTEKKFKRPLLSQVATAPKPKFTGKKSKEKSNKKKQAKNKGASRGGNKKRS